MLFTLFVQNDPQNLHKQMAFRCSDIHMLNKRILAMCHVWVYWFEVMHPFCIGMFQCTKFLITHAVESREVGVARGEKSTGG
jgi:hypothetical protein